MSRTFGAALCALLAIGALGRPVHGQAAEGAKESPAELAGGPEHRFLLLFDYPVGGLHQTGELSAAIAKWVDARLEPGDEVAVASYYGCALEVQQDFTRDRRSLAGAIADAVKGRSHDGLPPVPGAPSLVAGLPRGEELARRTANFYGLLQVLAEAADGVPGRKNLLLFSKGFGRSHLFEGETAVVHAEITGTGLPGNPIQEKYLTDRRLFEPTLHALQAAQVNLYPVDLATDYRETYPLAGVMCQLAAGTGGRYFFPALDLPALLDRVTEDERADRPAPERLERTERAERHERNPGMNLLLTGGGAKGRE